MTAWWPAVPVRRRTIAGESLRVKKKRLKINNLELV
jgi:hypothetical protein